MRAGVAVLSSAAQLRRFAPSPPLAATSGAALRLSTAQGAMIAPAASLSLRSDRAGPLPPLKTAARPALSTGTRVRLALTAGATRGLPARRAEPSSERAAPPPAPPPAASLPDLPADPPPGAPDEGEAARPAKPRRIEMEIDSLPHYDLLKPIPVVIEPLDDRMFAAQAPALQISANGSSIGAAFLQLKEQIAATYEQCRQKSTLTPERLRQLGLFQAYIGKPKRGWPLGRG